MREVQLLDTCGQQSARTKAIKKKLCKDIWNQLVCGWHQNYQITHRLTKAATSDTCSKAERREYPSNDGQKILKLFAHLQQYGTISHIGCLPLAIVLRCVSPQSSDALMQSFETRRLQQATEAALVSDSFKQRLGLKQLRLTVEIDEAEYLLCRKVLSRGGKTSQREKKKVTKGTPGSVPVKYGLVFSIFSSDSEVVDKASTGRNKVLVQ